MEVKLVITATKKEDAINVVGKSYVFKDASTITIGRGEPNNVPLTDPGRTVSRHHVEIVASADGYDLKDLDSKNFSFLNDVRVTSDNPRRLKNGDIIKVGDFCMEYFFLASRADLDITILDPELLAPDYDKDNPFEEAVKKVFEALDTLSIVYNGAQVKDKNAYLNHSIKKELPANGENAALDVMLNLLSDTKISEATQIPPASSAPLGQQVPPSQQHPSQELPTLDGQHESDNKMLLVLDAVLASLKQLIRIPYEFRGEFIGHTMWQDEESTFLYEGDHEVTKNYLLAEVASEEAIHQKLDRLKKASEKVVVHQVGMMEGYRAVVKEGLDQMLLEVDPAVLEKQIADASALYRFLPILASNKVLGELKDKIEKIQQTDWGVLEQRVYRPVFIRAYMSATSKDE